MLAISIFFTGSDFFRYRSKSFEKIKITAVLEWEENHNQTLICCVFVQNSIFLSPNWISKCEECSSLMEFIEWTSEICLKYFTSPNVHHFLREKVKLVWVGLHLLVIYPLSFKRWPTSYTRSKTNLFIRIKNIQRKSIFPIPCNIYQKHDLYIRSSQLN